MPPSFDYRVLKNSGWWDQLKLLAAPECGVSGQMGAIARLSFVPVKLFGVNSYTFSKT